MDVNPTKAKELIQIKRSLIVVDVRERHEYCGSKGHIPGAINLPWDTGIFQKRYQELSRDAEILVVCRRGQRSSKAAVFLEEHGYPRIYNMNTGMDKWQGEMEKCKD
jgi:rhodanese-related sulfurtransferase